MMDILGAFLPSDTTTDLAIEPSSGFGIEEGFVTPDRILKLFRRSVMAYPSLSLR